MTGFDFSLIDSDFYGNLRVFSAGYISHSVPFVWDTAGPLPDNDLVLILRGEGSITENGGEAISFATGDCLLCRRGEAYRMSMTPAALITEIFIHFDVLDDEGRAWPNPFSGCPRVVRGLPDLVFLRELGLRVLEGVHRIPASGRAETWFAALLQEVLKWVPPAENRLAGERRAQIHAAAMDVLADVTRSWSVAELATACHVSPDHFTRLFRREMGVSPEAFIASARMESAKRLLRGTGLSVGEIAEQTGYGSVYAFSRRFSKHCGVSPSAYRKAAREEGAHPGQSVE